jgi:hypothetical protein
MIKLKTTEKLAITLLNAIPEKKYDPIEIMQACCVIAATFIVYHAPKELQGEITDKFIADFQELVVTYQAKESDK